MDTTESAVLAILAGHPLTETASTAGLAPDELADAVELYRSAGRTALTLRAETTGWWQVNLEFASWHTAEQTVLAHVYPVLLGTEEAGFITQWWFLRKAPCWRLRIRPGQGRPDELQAHLRPLLECLQSTGHLAGWRNVSYEPETAAFGGPAGIDIAHRLHHTDSQGFFAYLHHQATEPASLPGRKELSFLLLSAMFRSAGLDWFEQGDVWHRVSQLRPPPGDVDPEQASRLAEDVRRLLSVDTNHLISHGPLTRLAAWHTGLTFTSQAFGQTARDGQLNRGLRAVLAHYVIFHWNRLGVPVGDQAVLAAVAQEAVLATGT